MDEDEAACCGKRNQFRTGIKVLMSLSAIMPHRIGTFFKNCVIYLLGTGTYCNAELLENLKIEGRLEREREIGERGYEETIHCLSLI